MFQRTVCNTKLKDGIKKVLTQLWCGRSGLGEGNGVGGGGAWSVGGDREGGKQGAGGEGRVIRQFGYHEDEEQQKADKSTGGGQLICPASPRSPV